MTSTALVGSTGLVGSHILSTLLSLPSVSSVHALARREPKEKDAKLTALVSSESAEWASKLSAVQPAPGVFYSALGTTRAAAGGIENQRKIDHDLNLQLAQAAKNAGVKVYVLISTSGASATSSMAYPKMKGELEEAVKGLGFEHTVLLRPGLIVGNRDEFRGAELVARKVAGFMGMFGLKDGWAQDADVIAKAAVSAGLKALAGEAPKGVWEIGQSEVIKLGRTEWKA
ncbi:Protein fmp-52, mitochondrial [Phlyctema vagabunda]|uniref:Protein fmp-52, mitochondrial n=1 Tax=Phlyctema vagabunda TaxID=108571 RepID=A0ABR4PFX4_9HELO